MYEQGLILAELFTALLFQREVFFGWNITSSHKFSEISEDRVFWLVDLDGHMTFEWDLTDKEMTMSFHKEETTRNQLCRSPPGFLVGYNIRTPEGTEHLEVVNPY